MGKDERFVDFNVDLDKLAKSIVDYAKKDGYTVRENRDPTPPHSWFQIQMTKKGLFRVATGTRRTLDIVIRGHPEDFEVALGTGEWGKNILSHTILGVITLGSSLVVMGLAVGIGTATYKRSEGIVWGKIRARIQELKNTHKAVGHAGIKKIAVASAKTSRFCKNCGEELPSTAKFCDECGTKQQR